MNASRRNDSSAHTLLYNRLGFRIVRTGISSSFLLRGTLQLLGHNVSGVLGSEKLRQYHGVDFSLQLGCFLLEFLALSSEHLQAADIDLAHPGRVRSRSRGRT